MYEIIPFSINNLFQPIIELNFKWMRLYVSNLELNQLYNAETAEIL